MLIKNGRYYGRFILLIIPLIIFMGCSVNSVYKKKGLELVNSGKYDDAIIYYKNALKKDPGNSSIKTLLQRAKLYGYYYHVALARDLKEKGKRESSINEYKIALSLLPGNRAL
ncbi:MAG: tetratricopeptide repeat protein, partial [Candidatus Aminicenantes bacterium]|nr:tetratricopeptide repeat protein [Candidatus Aminicenantes bacterium]